MMNNSYIQFQIHISTKIETNIIVDDLLNKKLAACITVNKSHSKYWWKGKINEEDIYIINGFSIAKNQKDIISHTKKYHTDEVPAIIFWPIDANKDFLEWIKNNTYSSE